MNFDEIKAYWEGRAASDSSAQSTTQDFYLREIELNALAERVPRYAPKLIADVGCGDGRTTTRLASKLPSFTFRGLDYSASMIDNARQVLAAANIPNVTFDVGDISQPLAARFDLIYTTRCLINLPSWDLQRLALDHIHQALPVGGAYLMIENFLEGQANFNQVRNTYGLPEIAVRNHNLFFDRAQLAGHLAGRFTVDEEVNISSTYYLVSRVIYSKLCAETGKSPDYFDDHHRFAAGLPFSGEFGPVRLVCFRKTAHS